VRTALSAVKLQTELKTLTGWEYKQHALEKEFVFANFSQALAFMVQIGLLAEHADHHPELRNIYQKVSVRWNTHTLGDVSELDVSMARKTDSLLSS